MSYGVIVVVGVVALALFALARVFSGFGPKDR
jgi:hypothetical protein